MKTIKFKAWDKRNQKWYDKIIEFIFNRPSGSIGHLPELPKDIELMQYTGLKDKNGVEIYEGDIVVNQKYRISKITGKKVKHGVKNKRVVKFSCRGKCGTPGYNLGFTNSEIIIGNIYENKELLK